MMQIAKVMECDINELLRFEALPEIKRIKSNLILSI
jgi:hypothetical protein